MLPSEAREHFVDVLAIFYGQPKHPNEIAMLLADKAPTMTTAELRACADHLVETRKSNSWPPMPEMLAALVWRPGADVLPPPGTWSIFVASTDPRWPGLVERFKRERHKSPPTSTTQGAGWYFPPNWITGTARPATGGEANALRLLHENPLAAQAVANRWAPALIEFVTANGREPSLEEEAKLTALSRRNDAEVAELTGDLGERLRKLRETMHQAAASRLGLAAPPAKRSATPSQPKGVLEASQRAAEANLERLKAEAADPDLAHKLAATPQLLKALADKAQLDALNPKRQRG